MITSSGYYNLKNTSHRVTEVMVQKMTMFLIFLSDIEVLEALVVESAPTNGNYVNRSDNIPVNDDNLASALERKTDNLHVINLSRNTRDEIE